MGPAMISGKNGGTTTVTLSTGYSISANGGEGAVNIRSGDTDFTKFWNPVPPLGGVGGVPWGIAGGNGVPSINVTRGKYYPGGTGGQLSGIASGGGGGNGGGTIGQAVLFGGETEAGPGKSGFVQLQILQPRPGFLDEFTKPPNPRLLPNAEAAFDSFIADAAARCTAEAERCPNRSRVKFKMCKVANIIRSTGKQLHFLDRVKIAKKYLDG
jgi:hypothetical protein